MSRAPRAAALVLWACANLAPSAMAFTVERVPRSLKDSLSSFARVADAPKTEFRKVPPAGSLSSGPSASRIESAPPASTVFRVAEVPPARVAATRELLTELKARQTERQAIVIDLPSDVLFDFDKAELRPDARESLDRAAELLKSYPDAPVAINGHTDGKGTDAYNDALSMRRAQAVAAMLQAGQPRQLSVHGFGKKRPLVPDVRIDGSDDPEARQRNRRVEIVIQPPDAAAAMPKKS
ncbi:conserved exported hypothetical protein [Burkholderiales bacterium 8X]|nr:conserved exported hypothetical protein [Burkholderiales bacterium 8X]